MGLRLENEKIDLTVRLCINFVDLCKTKINKILEGKIAEMLKGEQMLSKIQPNVAQNKFYKIIEEVNQDSQPVYIQGATDNQSAVLVSKKYYDALQETLALIENGQLAASIERQDDEYVDIDSMIREIDDETKQQAAEETKNSAAENK